jgi:hypothetical protein
LVVRASLSARPRLALLPGVDQPPVRLHVVAVRLVGELSRRELLAQHSAEPDGVSLVAAVSTVSFSKHRMIRINLLFPFFFVLVFLVLLFFFPKYESRFFFCWPRKSNEFDEF